MNNMESRRQMPLGNLPPRVNREQNKNLKPRKKKKNKPKMTGEERCSHVIMSGSRFIEVFTELLKETDVQGEIRVEYMQRLLHSIFFYGLINDPLIPPEDFIPEDRLTYFMNTFPRAFHEYSTHAPRQDPYAILLEFSDRYLWKVKLAFLTHTPLILLQCESVYDMCAMDITPKHSLMTRVLLWISTYKAFDDPRSLRNCLLEITVSLQFDDVGSYMPVANIFTASVIAISTYSDANGKVQMTAYGSSIAFKGNDQRKIMIAISALHVWDRVISYSVCQEGKSPAVLFPNQVQCKAYKFLPKAKTFKEHAPCVMCEHTFRNVEFRPLCCKENEEESWPYGNCAEYASFSKLLQARQDLRSGIVTEDQDGIQRNVRGIEDVFIGKYEGKLMEELRYDLGRNNFALSEELCLFQ